MSRPGGVWIFIDHVREHEDIFRRILQAVFGMIIYDCEFKNVTGMIQNGPFEKLVLKERRVLSGYLSVYNPVLFGYALKLKLKEEKIE